MSKKTVTKLLRDLKVGDTIVLGTGTKTIKSLEQYGTSHHSLAIRFENDGNSYVDDKMEEFEVLS